MADIPRIAAVSTESDAVSRSAREIVLVGAGARARAWIVPLQRSVRLRVVATVSRGAETVAPSVPRCDSLADAMRLHSAAAFAVALPPHAALAAALELAEAGRTAVVEAPLDEALLEAEPRAGAAGVVVAHGWVTLPGRRVIEALMQRVEVGRCEIEIAGLPEEARADAAEGLVHGLALVRALRADATPTAARQIDGGLEVELAASGWAMLLRILGHGHRLTLRLTSSDGPAFWHWEQDRERVLLGDRVLVAPRATPPAAVRALAQLVPNDQRGDSLRDAVAVLRLARTCRALLPTALPLGSRSFRQAVSIAHRRPCDLLGRLGLQGEIDLAAGGAPAILKIDTPREPFELWAFRAGLKPMVFLTVRPDEVDSTLAAFGVVQHVRRDRHVEVGAQDEWTDRRDQGEPRVELYIAHDVAVARRAAALQSELDPTRALREIGARAGYPSCCVEAFARQDDRANNSRNRYHSMARTCAPGGSTTAPWPWELNNLHTMIAPFYPCSYRCEAALAWARAALAELERVYPSSVVALRDALSRPSLYFDHEHQLVFDGASVDGIRIDYRAVALPAPAPREFGALALAIGRGDRLWLDDRALLVQRADQVVLRLQRTDPRLGFVAPFGLAT